MATPAGTIPPTLPPSVEEAYRRKCIQLRQRTIEIEESNDASRLRLIRAHRGIEKLRLERAFLLEQLARRTSTNVVDSEGSPSPPPTPQEKPLRTKRGHRKPSYLATLDQENTFVSQPTGGALSPTGSERVTPLRPEQGSRPSTTSTRRKAAAPSSNGYPPARHQAKSPPPKPKSGFDLYCRDMRDIVTAQNRVGHESGAWNADEELAQGWRDLTEDQRAGFQRRLEMMKAGDAENGVARSVDEDVEMGDDTDVAEENTGFTTTSRD